MVKIEYKNAVINVPTSWDDINLGLYETFYADQPETNRDRVAYAAKICQVAPEVLLDLPVDAFNEIVDRLGFVFTDAPATPDPVIEVDGVKYIIPIEEKLSTGAYIDAEEMQKGETGVLSGLLAIVCLPAGEDYDYENNEARAAMFAALPVSKIAPALAFFLRCFYGYEATIAAFLRVERLAALLPPSIPIFRNRGAGIKLFQIWPIIKYYFSIKLLNYRLRKYLRIYNTGRIKTTPIRPKGN